MPGVRRRVSAPVRRERINNLVPINNDFDLFSMGKDRQTSIALTARASQDDIIRGRSGGFIGLASGY